MSALEQIQNMLHDKCCIRKIPGIWIGKKGIFEKDVCRLLRKSIRGILQGNMPLPEEKRVKGSIYAMMPRTLTAWEDENGFHSGSFLMALLYLPQIKEMGVDILYLLPVFQTSDQHKKGKLGSPYAIRDFYQIDSILHDSLLGEFTPELMELQFKAFIEAAHLLSMHVMLDFVFRTVARDNVLIKEHPDWFYWKTVQKTAPLPKADFPPMTFLSDDNLERLYTHSEMSTYLDQFVGAPAVDDAWRETVDEGMEAVEKNYQITTMPAFSDIIHDVQPLWNDVTYLRYDLGRNAIAQKYADESFPPFIMYDSIKLDHYAAEKPNTALWEYIVNVLPFYITHYGIDGARIDMAHALPTELNKNIIRSARELKKDFLFWSEMLSTENSEQAKREGFDFISGATWTDYKKQPEEMMRNFIQTVFHSALPVAASLETPDTERIAVFYPIEKVKLYYVLNLLLPNTIPMFTNGFEILERQPMNLGLCQSEQARCVLAPNDPYYGKLAFFDEYRFHWENESIQSWIVYYGRLRKKCYHLINMNNMIMQYKDDVLGICYRDKQNVLCIILNFTDTVKEGCFFWFGQDMQIADTNKQCEKMSYHLKPYEVFTLFAGEKQHYFPV